MSWRTCYLKGRSLRCSPGQGNADCWVMTLYMGEGPRGSNGACSILPDFSHSLCYPQSNWALLVLLLEWVGLCMFWDPLGLSNELSCELGVSPAAASALTGVCSIRGLRLYFPALEPWVVWSVSPPHRSSWFIHTQMWDHQVLQPPPCA